MSKIYAIDFDGTLCKGMFPSIGEPIVENVEYVKKLKEDGNKLILWTCRVDGLLEDAVSWCKDQGIEFDAVNENLPEVLEKYGGDSRKITADYYIDDKNLTIENTEGGDGMERSQKETRQSYFTTEFKVRDSDEQDKKIIEGYFIRFNEETYLGQGIYEEVAPEAVTDSIMNNDIRALFNHDTGLVLARTVPNTMKLRQDKIGVFASLVVNTNDRQAMDALARVERGDISGASFGFMIKPGGEEMVTREDGTVKFILRDIDVHEVSVCTFPQYTTTAVNARMKDVEINKERQLQIRRQELLKKIKGGTV